MGDGTNHPSCSSLNVGSGGVIDFGGSKGIHVNGTAGEIQGMADDTAKISGTSGVTVQGSPFKITTTDLQINGTSGVTKTITVRAVASLNSKEITIPVIGYSFHVVTGANMGQLSIYVENGIVTGMDVAGFGS